MTVDQFVLTYNNKPVDFDGAYGNQCWDLAAQYSHDVVGLQGGAWQVMPTGPNGGAIEVFRNFQSPLPDYYDRIANNPNDPNQLPIKGDILIWNWGTYGHIAVCLGATANQLQIFEQNNPIGSVAHVNNNARFTGLAGWIRPKKGVNEVANRDQVNNIYKLGLLRDGDDGGLTNYTGKDANDIVSDMLSSAEHQGIVNDYNAKKQAVTDLTQKVDSLNQQLQVANDKLAQAVIPPTPPPAPKTTGTNIDGIITPSAPPTPPASTEPKATVVNVKTGLWASIATLIKKIWEA